DRLLSTKALEITPDPGGHVILKAVHFLVEIGSSGHARASGMHLLRSHVVPPQRPSLHGKRRVRSRNDMARSNRNIGLKSRVAARVAPTEHTCGRAKPGPLATPALK